MGQFLKVILKELYKDDSAKLILKYHEWNYLSYTYNMYNIIINK